MSILADFYNSDVITDPKYKFSPSGLYYAPPKFTYEEYVEFIKVCFTAFYLPHLITLLQSIFLFL